MPFIDDLIYSVNSFTRRRKIGSAMDKMMKVMIAEGSLKQQQFAELHELMYSQVSEIANLEKQKQLLKSNGSDAQASSDLDATVAALRLKHEANIRKLRAIHENQLVKLRESQSELLAIINVCLGTT